MECLKKIECILRVEKLERHLWRPCANRAFRARPSPTLQGFGKERLIADPYLKEKVKIEIYLEESELDSIVDTLIAINNREKSGTARSPSWTSSG